MDRYRWPSIRMSPTHATVFHTNKQFSHPSFLFFLTTLISVIFHIPIFLIIWLSKPLRHQHVPFFLVPFCVTAATLFCALLANYLVRRARQLESDRIFRMLSDVSDRQNEENRLARAWIGSGGGAWARFVDFVVGVVELLAGLVGLIVVTVSTCKSCSELS